MENKTTCLIQNLQKGDEAHIMPLISKVYATLASETPSIEWTQKFLEIESFEMLTSPEKLE